MFRDQRRVRAVLLSAAAALLVVTAGGQTTTATDVEPVTITYLASQNWVLESERELAAQFEAETGIHVDYQIIPADQYFSVLQTKLESGGEGIDIFGGQSGKTDIQLQLGVEENAVPLTDEEWVQRMDPLSTEQISLDGIVYGQTIWDTVGICRSVLAQSVSEDDRSAALARNEAFNEILERICARYSDCRYDGGAVFDHEFGEQHIGSLDYFHPSIDGQAVLADVTWRTSFWPEI